MQIIKFLIVILIFGFQFSNDFIFSLSHFFSASLAHSPHRPTLSPLRPFSKSPFLPIAHSPSRPFSLSFFINPLNYKNISIDWCSVISLYVVKHILSVHVFVYLRGVTAHGEIHTNLRI